MKKGADDPGAAAWSSEAGDWTTEGNTDTVDGAGRSLDTRTTKVTEALLASSGRWTVGSVAGSDRDILPAVVFLLFLGLSGTSSSSSGSSMTFRGAEKRSVDPRLIVRI